MSAGCAAAAASAAAWHLSDRHVLTAVLHKDELFVAFMGCRRVWSIAGVIGRLQGRHSHSQRHSVVCCKAGA
jgi:hypothetical protein